MSREEIEKGSAPRRTLMIGDASHTRIAALSDAHGVKHYQVIDALLDAVVPEAFQQAVERLRLQRRETAAERQRKRKLLENVIDGLAMQDLEALIAAIKSGSLPTARHGE